MKFLPALFNNISRILLATVVIALTTAILMAIQNYLSTTMIALFYLLVVVFCTTLGRFTVGIAASVFAFLAYDYFFLPPNNLFVINDIRNVTALFVFLLVSIVISNLMDRAQTRLEQVETRERESALIYAESDRLKTAILASVSHDLRTPLAAIQAAASSLFDSSKELDPESRQELQTLLLVEIDRLNQLVGNLLNMSRIEAGALKLQMQSNSLADLIDTVIELMQRQTALHQVEVDVSEDLPLVQIDATLIEQVFINLIDNSVKYAPPGSRIHVRAWAEDSAWMQINLANQGPSIPEEHLDHIFDKFYFFPGMRQVSSTGLGLSICKGIIDAHGGKIWAANTSEGLAFCFTLPLQKSGNLSFLYQDESTQEDI